MYEFIMVHYFCFFKKPITLIDHNDFFMFNELLILKTLQ